MISLLAKWFIPRREQVADSAVRRAWGALCGFVGIALNLTHDAATPVGMKVWAESTVTAINGRKVSFSITAYDETGVIGTCDHQRAIIDNEKFFTRCQNKLSH